jgi:hypothetical protein
MFLFIDKIPLAGRWCSSQCVDHGFMGDDLYRGSLTGLRMAGLSWV